MGFTLVVIKPDAVKRGFVGEIISRFENKGFEIQEAKFLSITESQAEYLYSVHQHKEFYKNLINFMIKGQSLVMILGRYDAVMTARRLTGAIGPDGLSSEPGTIRGDFATGVTENVIHSSDRYDRAAYEAFAFFNEATIDKYWPRSV